MTGVCFGFVRIWKTFFSAHTPICPPLSPFSFDYFPLHFIPFIPHPTYYPIILPLPILPSYSHTPHFYPIHFPLIFSSLTLLFHLPTHPNYPYSTLLNPHSHSSLNETLFHNFINTYFINFTHFYPLLSHIPLLPHLTSSVNIPLHPLYIKLSTGYPHIHKLSTIQSLISFKSIRNPQHPPI